MRLAIRRLHWATTLLSLNAVAAVNAAESPYRMEGVVTDAGTQLPVAGATAQVLIASEPDPLQKIKKGVTNQEGRYSIELPAGHAWAWVLLPPEGYCSAESGSSEVFATTESKPVFKKNYRVRKGTPVRFLARYPGSPVDLTKTYISLGQQKDGDYVHGFCELGADARGVVTLLNPAGEFKLSCGDERQTLVAPSGMAIHFEQGFDPRDVSDDLETRDNAALVVRDSQGHAATLTNCKAVIEDGELTVAIDLESKSPDSPSTQLEGRVVGENGQGVEGATVTVAFYSSDGGSWSSQIATTTGSDGAYKIAVPGVRDDQKAGLIVTREAYGGVDTRPITPPAGTPGVVEVAPIKLKAGCSIRVRVLGADGQPVHGAVVEPANDYASRTRIARTDENGECLLTDLAAGVMRVSAAFGSQSLSTKIPLDSGENELVVLKLQAKRSPSAAQAPKTLAVLKAGSEAPEWSISQWTDGKERQLADYRGKVVVIDFWGIWCSPCINAIPSMKTLHDRYAGEGVVFLGVHTAGTDMALVKRLMKQQEWELAVGLDVGEDINSSETAQRYAVQGYPSVTIVDRNGIIRFNSNDTPADREAFLQELEEIAELSGLPWPLDKDATVEEAAAWMNRLQVARLSRVIDETLKSQGE